MVMRGCNPAAPANTSADVVLTAAHFPPVSAIMGGKSPARCYVNIMFYLIYISTATREMDGGTLRDILKTSRGYNATHGITGLLLFKEGRFMQLLEGDETAVRELYRRILRDERHRGIATLLEGNDKERMFPGWAMAFRSAGENAPQGVDAVLPWEADEIEFTEAALSAHSSRALELLRLFRDHM